MNSVVSLREFKERARHAPTLVLVDMHHGSPAASSGASKAAGEAIANCRAMLRHARACQMPVAFTRQVVSPTSMLASPIYPRWIQGFEPSRWDMIFDRHLPSCYASADFRDMAEDVGGHYVVAGQFAELACLSTAIDAFHRDHHPIFLSDALVVRGNSELPAELMGKSLISILSLYSQVARTQPWIAELHSVGAPI